VGDRRHRTGERRHLRRRESRCGGARTQRGDGGHDRLQVRPARERDDAHSAKAREHAGGRREGAAHGADARALCDPRRRDQRRDVEVASELVRGGHRRPAGVVSRTAFAQDRLDFVDRVRIGALACGHLQTGCARTPGAVACLVLCVFGHGTRERGRVGLAVPGVRRQSAHALSLRAPDVADAPAEPDAAADAAEDAEPTRESEPAGAGEPESTLE